MNVIEIIIKMEKEKILKAISLMETFHYDAGEEFLEDVSDLNEAYLEVLEELKKATDEERSIEIAWKYLQELTKNNEHKPWHNPDSWWRDCQVCCDIKLEKESKI